MGAAASPQILGGHRAKEYSILRSLPFSFSKLPNYIKWSSIHEEAAESSKCSDPLLCPDGSPFVWFEILQREAYFLASGEPPPKDSTCTE